jgi:hypothetical protein
MWVYQAMPPNILGPPAAVADPKEPAAVREGGDEQGQDRPGQSEREAERNPAPGGEEAIESFQTQGGLEEEGNNIGRDERRWGTTWSRRCHALGT